MKKVWKTFPLGSVGKVQKPSRGLRVYWGLCSPLGKLCEETEVWKGRLSHAAALQTLVNTNPACNQQDFMLNWWVFVEQLILNWQMEIFFLVQFPLYFKLYSNQYEFWFHFDLYPMTWWKCIQFWKGKQMCACFPFLVSLIGAYSSLASQHKIFENITVSCRSKKIKPIHWVFCDRLFLG